jgi:hypothetical protein
MRMTFLAIAVLLCAFPSNVGANIQKQITSEQAEPRVWHQEILAAIPGKAPDDRHVELTFVSRVHGRRTAEVKTWIARRSVEEIEYTRYDMNRSENGWTVLKETREKQSRAKLSTGLQKLFGQLTDQAIETESLGFRPDDLYTCVDGPMYLLSVRVEQANPVRLERAYLCTVPDSVLTTIEDLS